MAMMTVMAGQRLLKDLSAGDFAGLRRVLKFRGQLGQGLGLCGIPVVLRRRRVGLQLRRDAGRGIRVLGRALLLKLIQLTEETGNGRNAGRVFLCNEHGSRIRRRGSRSAAGGRVTCFRNEVFGGGVESGNVHSRAIAIRSPRLCC